MQQCLGKQAHSQQQTPQRSKSLGLLASSIHASPVLQRRGQQQLLCSAAADSHAVAVTFKLSHKVDYGQQMAILGAPEQLGMWRQDAAVPLAWSTGDVWTVQVDLTSGEKAEYKYLIRRGKSIESWQEGNNCNVTPPATAAAIDVENSWSNSRHCRMHVTHERPTPIAVDPAAAETVVPPDQEVQDPLSSHAAAAAVAASGAAATEPDVMDPIAASGPYSSWEHYEQREGPAAFESTDGPAGLSSSAGMAHSAPVTGGVSGGREGTSGASSLDAPRVTPRAGGGVGSGANDWRGGGNGGNSSSSGGADSNGQSRVRQVPAGWAAVASAAAAGNGNGRNGSAAASVPEVSSVPMPTGERLDLETMCLSEIKVEVRRRGMSSLGNRRELIERLQDAGAG